MTTAPHTLSPTGQSGGSPKGRSLAPPPEGEGLDGADAADHRDPLPAPALPAFAGTIAAPAASAARRAA
ncbi:hypothetical protein [Streptomyces sp. NPDC058861]|uniref:hypothetical protein n=1 Tax=Streptomyces sp. NPDC058861 TaxID=3346653 RepID=UPI0036B72B3E